MTKSGSIESNNESFTLQVKKYPTEYLSNFIKYWPTFKIFYRDRLGKNWKKKFNLDHINI